MRLFLLKSCTSLTPLSASFGMALTHDEIASSGHRSRLMSQPLESPGFRRGVGPFRTLIIASALLLTAGVALRVSPSVAEGARAIPAPALVEPATPQLTS